MTKKLAKALAKLQKFYAKRWSLKDFQLRLALLESGPCWVAQVNEHKGLHRKCPLKAIKDLRKQLDRMAINEGTAPLYPPGR